MNWNIDIGELLRGKKKNNPTVVEKVPESSSGSEADNVARHGKYHSRSPFSLLILSFVIMTSAAGYLAYEIYTENTRLTRSIRAEKERHEEVGMKRRQLLLKHDETKKKYESSQRFMQRVFSYVQVSQLMEFSSGEGMNRLVDKIAKAHNIIYSNYRGDPLEQRIGAYTYMGRIARMKLRGKYRDIGAFTETLENTLPLARVMELEMRPSVEGQEGNVEVTLSVFVIKNIKELEAERPGLMGTVSPSLPPGSSPQMGAAIQKELSSRLAPK